MDPSSETLRALVSRLARSERAAATAASLDLHDLEQLEVPDSYACREAERICREASSESLANHCFRSYAWGALLGVADGVAWDAEIFYVAAMLHDLGLTDSYDGGGCFESDGADAARKILAEIGWDDVQTATVADAIYLHMHDVTDEDSPEARLLAIGTTVDVSGGRALEVPQPSREFVLKMFPRLGFKEHFIALFDDQASRKPHCIVHRYMHEYALAKRIREAPYAE